MGLLRLQRRGAGAAVGDEPGHDPVQVRQSLLVVIGVAVEAHELPALPFDELERPGADRRFAFG